MRKRKMTPRREALLREALRRWRMRPIGNHTGGETLATAWTGLGTATQYKPALDAGWMEYATEPNPGYMTWFRLTEAGAAIVRGWMSLYECVLLDGLEHDHHESDLYLKDCSAARELLKEHAKRGRRTYEVDGWNVSLFTSEIDGERWLDIPFSYEGDMYGPDGLPKQRRGAA